MSTIIANAMSTIEARFMAAGVTFVSGEPQKSSIKAKSGPAAKVGAKLDSLRFDDVGRGMEHGNAPIRGVLTFTMGLTSADPTTAFSSSAKVITAGHNAIQALDGADGIRVGNVSLTVRSLDVQFVVQLTCSYIANLTNPSSAFAGRI